jgi:hypothetical protein
MKNKYCHHIPYDLSSHKDVSDIDVTRRHECFCTLRPETITCIRQFSGYTTKIKIKHQDTESEPNIL